MLHTLSSIFIPLSFIQYVHCFFIVQPFVRFTIVDCSPFVLICCDFLQSIQPCSRIQSYAFSWPWGRFNGFCVGFMYVCLTIRFHMLFHIWWSQISLKILPVVHLLWTISLYFLAKNLSKWGFLAFSVHLFCGNTIQTIVFLCSHRCLFSSWH